MIFSLPPPFSFVHLSHQRKISELINFARGTFRRGDMQKEFEDVAFALEPGSMSGPVSSASGIHLILRTE